VGGAIFARFVDRVDAEERVARTTLEAAVPSVTVIHPQAGAPDQQIVLPGYTQAFTDTPVYARTNGYLKAWRFDIGAHVSKGDLLAEIDTPEVDQQLRQARSDLATAQANLQLAAITAKRNEELLKTRSVSTQDRDNADGTLAADKAIVQSNEGNVARLEQLQSYEKIYAPFDGIVTARNTDTGALIDAGANSPSKELFHLTANDTLRVYVAVPEPYSSAAQAGATASLTLDEFPGESFHGRLVRNANTIDLSSRTLLVEVDVDNPAGRLRADRHCDRDLLSLAVPERSGRIREQFECDLVQLAQPALGSRPLFGADRLRWRAAPRQDRSGACAIRCRHCRLSPDDADRLPTGRGQSHGVEHPRAGVPAAGRGGRLRKEQFAPLYRSVRRWPRQLPPGHHGSDRLSR
jgi:RND family efflux transporter MFP subunit